MDFVGLSNCVWRLQVCNVKLCIFLEVDELLKLDT